MNKLFKICQLYVVINPFVKMAMGIEVGIVSWVCFGIIIACFYIDKYTENKQMNEYINLMMFVMTDEEKKELMRTGKFKMSGEEFNKRIEKYKNKEDKNNG